MDVERNPLYIADGTFSYIKDIRFDKDIYWKSEGSNSATLGKIGWFGEDYELSKYGKFKENVSKLDELLKSFSPLNSYSLAILVYQGDKTIKTVDYHYLVNNTTNAYDLMDNVYLKISELSIRYKFKIGDTIICKYKPLYYKVKDPKFKGGKIDNTMYKPTDVKLDVQNRILSSSFLPHTMDINYYGVLQSKRGNVFYFLYNKYYIKLEIISWRSYHKIQVLNSKTLKSIVNIEDLAHEDGFIREIKTGKSSTYLYYNNEFNLLNIEFEPSIKYLTTADKEFKHNIKILTFDIETYKDKGKFIPYACGFYDGKNKFLYYVSDYNSHNDMIYQCLKDMLKPKYHNYTVYAHNLSKFDISFIFSILVKNYKVSKLLPRDVSLISFEVSTKINKEKVILRFADSLCLLPFNLSDLGYSFNVETKKDFFPYNFVQSDNLDYVGPLPDIKYFDQPDNFIFRYQLMINWYTNNWSLKQETLNYLSKDLISLHQILVKMDSIIFSNYRINITSHRTIASLSIANYRSNFLKCDELLPKSKGELEVAIRSSYYGGRCEVFKPFGNNLYYYDKNSLYPSAMLQDMPVGQPTYSLIKDIYKIFGFVKVKVTTPDNLYIPVLPCRINTDKGFKLFFPLGSWTNWYFSEEVKLAIRYGYKIEVLESYIYERGKDVFKDYVIHMANIKERSVGAMREIHKLLLNTPYGRMGMKNDRDVIKLVSKKEFQDLELRYNITYYKEIDEDKVLVKYGKYADKLKCEQSDIDYEAEMQKFLDTDNVNNSPAIASAVASWSRIIMYPYITKSYYTDTDSVFLAEPLNSNEIGKSLGQFKLEYGCVIKKAIFPSPKLYILDTILGLVCRAKGYSKGDLTLFDYMDIYKGGFIEVKDVRWKRYLGLDTISLEEMDYRIRGDYDKRNKLYSKGRWVDTSPLVVNSLFQIVNTELIIKERNAFAIIEQIKTSTAVVQYHKKILDLVLLPATQHKKILDLVLSPSLKRLDPVFVPDTRALHVYKDNVKIKTSNRANKIIKDLVGLTYEELKTYVDRKIYDSKMLAANETEIVIYRITGILYDSDSRMYYLGEKQKRVYFYKKGRYVFSNVRIVSGYLKINSKIYIKNPDADTLICSNSLTCSMRYKSKQTKSSQPK